MMNFAPYCIDFLLPFTLLLYKFIHWSEKRREKSLASTCSLVRLKGRDMVQQPRLWARDVAESVRGVVEGPKT